MKSGHDDELKLSNCLTQYEIYHRLKDTFHTYNNCWTPEIEIYREFNKWRCSTRTTIRTVHLAQHAVDKNEI